MTDSNSPVLIFRTGEKYFEYYRDQIHEMWPYSIDVGGNKWNVSEMSRWAHENFGIGGWWFDDATWWCNRNIFYFKNGEDATFFALRWL